jgi:tRNA nucleotidyltransferase (CCA-adding enzyme)
MCAIDTDSVVDVSDSRGGEDGRKRAVCWRHFRHEADIGLHGAGEDKAAAFEAIALALTAVVTDPDKVLARKTVTLRCRAPSDEVLLVDWLNALIYEMAVRKMLFSRFEVTITNGELSARATGEAVDRSRHQPAVEVKGATYTSLAVEQADDQWIARCVVDV